MIDRAAIILRYKQPVVDWINEADPYDRDPGTTLDHVNEERTVYLIEERYVDSPADFERWLKRNYKTLFEAELMGWYTDPSLWPKQRSLKVFNEWFDVECHTVIFDLGKYAIHDDEHDAI